MGIKAQDLALRLSGTVEGDPNVEVSRVARIERGESGAISFLANLKYEHFLYSCKSSIILLNRDYQLLQPIDTTIIRVDDAYQAIATVLSIIQESKKSKKRANGWCYPRPLSSKVGRGTSIGKGTVISKNVKVGQNCYIYPQVYLGRGVKVGNNCTIYPGVKIYEGCVVGDNCIIHANSVIGADGFGFAPMEDGSYKKIPQTGNVVIENDVEIGANCSIDRATMGSTIIHQGVKIDNLCQVAHNVEIGSHTVVAALSGFAGSSKIGKYCQFGGQSGVVGHLEVADHTTLAAKSGIVKSVKREGEVLMGYPAIDHRHYLKSYVIFKQNGSK